MESQRRRTLRHEALGAAALAFALSAQSARADEIDDLVAAGRSLDALPLAMRDARAGGDSASWQRALQIAQWNSRDDEALEALRALVRVEGDAARWRFELARRLLWRRALVEAEPHARWLSEHARDADALEVAYWVMSGLGHRAEALSLARRRVEASRGDVRARWALADLTHWSSSWREARAQYRALAASPAESRRAAERAEMLRRDHPDEVVVDASAWCDSVGVQQVTVGASGGVQLPSRLVLRVRAEALRWSQGPACGIIERTLAGTLAGQPNALLVGALAATLRVEASDAVHPELTVGVEGDGSGNVAPTASLGLRLSVAGRVFGRAWVQHERYRASLASAHGDVRAMGPALSLYAEPARWAFAAVEGSAWWLDDGNLRVRGLVAAGVHNVGAWQVEPRAFAQVEWFESQRPLAVPYFTPADPLTWGGDVTLRYMPSQRLRAEAAFGVAVQAGQVALRPSLLVRADVGRHVRLSASAGYVGSPLYQQLRAELGVGWVF